MMRRILHIAGIAAIAALGFGCNKNIIPPQVPRIPNLISPANNVVNQQTTLTLTWESCTCAKSYSLQVSTSSAFSTVIPNQADLTTASGSISGLAGNTTYYWQVNASNEAGSSAWSAMWTFTTTSSQSVPALGSPANGAIEQQTTVALSWGAVGGGLSYGIQVSTASNFATTISNQPGLTSTSDTISGLVNGATYYWRANATDASGTGPWSNAWSFTIQINQSTVPVSPINGSPNGATNQPTSLIISWGADSNATTYDLRISTAANFATTVLYQAGLATPTIVINGLADSMTYYWQVDASNAAGTSSWSGVWSFSTTLIPLPSMVVVIGATFQMGSSDAVYDSGAQPPHLVTLSSSYYMDRTEVTQSNFQQTMGFNPSGFGPGPNLPVESVTWFDAVLYCNARSKLGGFDTVYSYTAKTINGNTCTALAGLAIDYTKHGFRLPTEAEWEYACRGGTTTAYYWGNDSSAAIFGQYAWDTANAAGSTQTVATKLPNAYGLYDMSGNVWEWCNDWYSGYTAAQQIDPTGPSTGISRVLRGGSWWDNAVFERSAFRFSDVPSLLYSNYGFRCVRR
jgi:formylglycine-generating enzyme required for sulfatase activity